MIYFPFVGIHKTACRGCVSQYRETTFLVMGNSEAILKRLNQLREEQSRSWAWVARTSGVPYKRVLAEVKHCTVPIKLDTAIAVSAALGTSLADLRDTPVQAAAA